MTAWPQRPSHIGLVHACFILQCSSDQCYHTYEMLASTSLYPTDSTATMYLPTFNPSFQSNG
uniref:Uncharacterized protein n=1 Tax=Arion vulgaris TaxID=1028688 RepID=A0A0B7BRA3_9EUPU